MVSLSSFLNQIGIGWMIWGLCAAWLFLALPMMLFQLRVIADIAGYVLTGKTIYFPVMLESVRTGEAERQFNALPEDRKRDIVRLWPFVWAAGVVSPLSALAAWSFLILVRLPHSAHEPSPAPDPWGIGKLIQRTVFEEVVERFSEPDLPAAA